MEAFTQITFWGPVLAVILSYGVLTFFKPGNQSHIQLFLAFSGAFLLGLTLFEFLPEIYGTKLEVKFVSGCIVLGMLMQIILEFFSKGAEHGHTHGSTLIRTFPWTLFISLSIHSLIEGLPLTRHDHFVWGIIIHKIPVAIILGGFLNATQLSTTSKWIFIIAFALMSPIGGLLGAYRLFSTYEPYLLALVIGVLLHISTTILFESSQGHRFNAKKLAVILVGFILAYLL